MKQYLRKIENFRKRNEAFNEMLKEELKKWNEFIKVLRANEDSTSKRESWDKAYHKLEGVREIKSWTEDELSEYINTIYPELIGKERL